MVLNVLSLREAKTGGNPVSLKTIILEALPVAADSNRTLAKLLRLHRC